MANFSFVFPLTAGAIIATQIALESKTRLHQGVIPVAFFAFTLAFIACLAWAWWAGVNPFIIKGLQFSNWFGGPSRIAYLLLMTAPLIGIGNADKMCLVVVGQVLAGVVIEHFGLLGVKQCKLDWQAVLGIFGLMLSLLLILKRPCVPVEL
jgi:transporter family-2 protein